MKFIVEDKVFAVLPAACFGVVVARGLDNRSVDVRPAELLRQSIAATESKFAAAKAKESVEIAPYREAFARLGINPNKFLSSIEAIYLAYSILGYDTKGLLDRYLWKEAFLAKNNFGTV